MTAEGRSSTSGMSVKEQNTDRVASSKVVSRCDVVGDRGRAWSRKNCCGMMHDARICTARWGSRRSVRSLDVAIEVSRDEEIDDETKSESPSGMPSAMIPGATKGVTGGGMHEEASNGGRILHFDLFRLKPIS
jgi:hypothetical protein